MDRYPTPFRDPLRLDDGTADRLLQGLPPDDAPRAYRGVAAMVAGLTAAPSAEELDGEQHAVTTIARQARVSITAHRSERPPRRRTRRTRSAGFALVCSATLLVGLGAAGALPGAAQTVASDVLASVGVSTPAPDTHAGTHPDERGNSGTTGATGSGAVHPTASGGSSADGGPTGAGGSNGKGSTISDLAQDDTTTGVDHGAAVSSAASDGQSQAGQNGQGASNSTDAGPPADAGTPPDTTPVTTPAPDGNANGNAPGNSRAGAGSGNADNGLSNKP